MRRILALSLALASVACSTASGPGGRVGPAAAATPSRTSEPELAPGPPAARVSLDSQLEAIRAKGGVPGLAAAVTRAGGEVARGAAGVRRRGLPDPVRATDAFHVGSVTKPFTATLAGMLVAEGRLRWDVTLAEAFASSAMTMRPQYADATLAELLSHEAGIRPFTEEEELAGLAFEGSPRAQRLAFVRHVLSLEPVGPRGEFHYSNAGFTTAAVILEQVTGAAWESLLRERIFTPLGLSTARFGWPARQGAPAPWGHLVDGGAAEPQDPAGDYQLPPTLAPAGDVAMSMPDLATFLREHLRALRGEPALLPAAIAEVMHTRRVRGGLGFGVGKVRQIEPVSTFSGSAGTFLCMIAIAPRHDVAVAVAANAADEGAETAVKEALVALLETYALPDDPGGG